MFIRINAPFFFHFQTWHEWQPKGMPFLYREKGGGVFYVGRRRFQFSKSEGNFVLLETAFLRFQLGDTGHGWPA